MIQFIDRQSGTICTEKVYGWQALKALYGDGPLAWLLQRLVCCFPFVSRFMGYWMKRPASRKKIDPFIQQYGIAVAEFAEFKFESFNDFFIRKLKPECRPLVQGANRLAAPADGRYLVYPKFTEFTAKRQKFCLRTLLQDDVYANRFREASLLIARLCPTDYHRFHFPCDGMAHAPRLINGLLHSVSPIAICKNWAILSENKRVVTEIETDSFGTVLYVEIGATGVGSIRQTFSGPSRVAKGQEKGYFEFGGSCIVFLFEKNRISFDADLVANTKRGYETLCRYGEGVLARVS